MNVQPYFLRIPLDKGGSLQSTSNIKIIMACVIGSTNPFCECLCCECSGACCLVFLGLCCCFRFTGMSCKKCWFQCCRQEFLHCMWHLDQEQFRLSFLSDDVSPIAFWRFYLSQSWGVGHPIASAISEAERKHTLPILWHVDGAQIHNDSEYYIFSWQSFLSSGDVWNVKFPLCLLPHVLMNEEQVQYVTSMIATVSVHASESSANSGQGDSVSSAALLCATTMACQVKVLLSMV